MLNLVNWLKLRPTELLKPSVLFLIVANLSPLYGIFFLDWPVFPVIVLFWMENVIIGIYNVFKMALASPGDPAKWAAKAAAIPFFCVHYGMFTLVHGLFVFVMFGGFLSDESSFPDAGALFSTLAGYQLLWPFLALFLSHTLSFVFNYIGKGEYKQASLNELMSEPYGRVVILHITIVLGSFVVIIIDSPAGALLLLVLIKTFVDLKAHLKQHTKYRDSRKQVDASRPQVVE